MNPTTPEKPEAPATATARPAPDCCSDNCDGCSNGVCFECHPDCSCAQLEDA